MADLIMECQAIADLFEDRPRSVPSNRRLDVRAADYRHESTEHRTADASETRGGDAENAHASDDERQVIQKRQLVSRQLDPDKLTAWLQGAHMPSGLQKSQCPFMKPLMDTPPAKPQMLVSGHPPASFGVFHLGETSGPKRWPEARRPCSAGGASCHSSPSGGASAFFWGDASAQHGDGGLARRCYDGDKPSMTGGARESKTQRESETHRLRRLLDPRYRRCPAQQPSDSSNVDHRECRDGGVLQPEPPQTSPSRKRPAVARMYRPTITDEHAAALPEESQRKTSTSSVGTSRPSTAGRASRPSTAGRSSRPSTAPPGKCKSLASEHGTSQKVSHPTNEPRSSIPQPPIGRASTSSKDYRDCQHILHTEHTTPRMPGKLIPRRKAVSNFTKWRQKDQVYQAKLKDNLKRHQEAYREKQKEENKTVINFSDELKNMFRGGEATVKFSGDKPEVSIPVTVLQRLAAAREMSMDDAFLVRKVFESYDEDNSGTLDIEEFDDAVAKLLLMQLGEQATAERVESLTGWQWWDSDVDKTGTISFKEFLDFYACNGFNEELLTSEDQRQLRKIAKAHGVKVDQVERIKAIFDSCDDDQSGEVELDEFKHILHKCLKVPPNCWVPPSRVQYFWSQIDTDCSGKITFGEFFRWWLRYFDEKCFDPDQGNAPFEDFYKQVRRMGAAFLDPPPDLPPAKAQDDLQLLEVTQELFSNLQDHTKFQRTTPDSRTIRYSGISNKASG